MSFCVVYIWVSFCKSINAVNKFHKKKYISGPNSFLNPGYSPASDRGPYISRHRFTFNSIRHKTKLKMSYYLLLHIAKNAIKVKLTKHDSIVIFL